MSRILLMTAICALLLTATNAIGPSSNIVYLSSAGSATWTGNCVTSTCTAVAPCLAPSSAALLTDCNLVLLSYDSLPTMTISASSTITLNISGSATTNNSITFSLGSSTLRFVDYVGLHNSSSSVNAGNVYFQNATIDDYPVNPASPTTSGFFRMGYSVASLTIIDSTFNMYARVNAISALTANMTVWSSGCTFNANFPSAPAMTVGGVFQSFSTPSAHFENFTTYGAMPFTGVTAQLELVNGVANNLWNGYDSLSTPALTLIISNVSFTMSSGTIQFLSLANVPTISISKLSSTTTFGAAGFASFHNVSSASFDKCIVLGAVILFTDQTRDSSVSVLRSKFDVSSIDGGASFVLIGPPSYSPASPYYMPGLIAPNAHVTLDVITSFRHPWNGQEMSIGNNIHFVNPAKFKSLNLRDMPANISAPSLEIVDEFRTSTSLAVQPVFFNTSLTLHAADLGNIQATLRDDEITYVAEQKFSRGMQSNIAVNVSTLHISWTLSPPPVLRAIAIGLNIMEVQNIDFGGDTRWNATVDYAAWDTRRLYAVFNPQPCPRACANTYGEVKHQNVSLCSSNADCFDTIYNGVVRGAINWRFGDISTSINGSVTYDASASFGGSYILEYGTDTTFNSHLTVQNALNVSFNSSLTVFGDANLHDATGIFCPYLNNVTIGGDLVSPGGIEFGPEGKLVIGGSTIQLSQSINVTGSSVDIDSSSISVDGDIGFHANTTLSLLTTARFVASGDLILSETLVVSINVPPNTSDTSNAPIAPPSASAPGTGTPAFFDVEGNAMLGGSMFINLTQADLEAIKQNGGALTIVNAKQISGNLQLATETHGGCLSATGGDSTQIVPNGGKQSLVAIFQVTDNCPTNPDGSPASASTGPNSPAAKAKAWPIIVGVVCGTVVLGVIVAGVVVMSVPSIKLKVLPFL